MRPERRTLRRLGIAGASIVAVVLSVIGVQEWANPEPAVLPGTVYSIDHPAAVTDDLLIGTVEGSGHDEPDRLRAVRLDGGEIAWERERAGSINAVESGVLVLGDDEEWVGIDAETGDDLWTVTAPWTADDHQFARVTVVGSGTVLISRSIDGPTRERQGAIAVDARTGRTLWSTTSLILTGTETINDFGRVVRSSHVIENQGVDEPMTVRDLQTGETIAALPYAPSIALIGDDLVAAIGKRGDEHRITVRRLPDGVKAWEADHGLIGRIDGVPGTTSCSLSDDAATDLRTGHVLDLPESWNLDVRPGRLMCASWAHVHSSQGSVALWKIGTDVIRPLPTRTPDEQQTDPARIVVNGARGAVVVGDADDRLGRSAEQTDVWFEGERSAWRSERLLAAGGFGDPRLRVRTSLPDVGSLWTDHGYLAFRTADGTRLIDLES